MAFGSHEEPLGSVEGHRGDRDRRQDGEGGLAGRGPAALALAVLVAVVLVAQALVYVPGHAVLVLVQKLYEHKEKKSTN